MIDNCYIDGISICNRFGVWVTKGGYKDLLTFPALVDPDTNDWPEEDGIEVDLSKPKIQPKDITISFLASNRAMNVIDFVAFLSQPGYHTLRVPILNREWRLRLSTYPTNKVYPNACGFSLKFIEDTPAYSTYIPLPDPGVIIHDSGYELDGIPFSDYGVVVDRAKDELLKAPAVKKNLTRKVITHNGQQYDVDHLVFSSKESTFKCYFKAASIERFWQCYDAFFGVLIQPDERLLYVDSLRETYPCYYKKSSGFKILSLRGPVIMEFNLTLVFTVFRIQEMEYLLASEDGRFIMTEDGEHLIDMK
ncbi:hypothetical protein [Parabacteroides goldsteinii]|mgnify:FL=1|jgi:hypothetical protein|uniref:hypothetical protein n=1 Tax=Parabacteroides goldsteinii TaxID=328812 RepID=UPI00189D7D7E|nr:hypothetical protein [Parabacteroides goldsteinii]